MHAELFIREALVAGTIKESLPFLKHNLRLIEQIEKMEHKSRRQDILWMMSRSIVFYDQHLPAEMHRVATLAHWYMLMQRSSSAYS